jgi:UDP-glucose 4-epimerase
MFNSKINMLPERKGNRMSASVNTHRAKNELGWEAKNNFKDHIADFIVRNKKI